MLETKCYANTNASRNHAVFLVQIIKLLRIFQYIHCFSSTIFYFSQFCVIITNLLQTYIINARII